MYETTPVMHGPWTSMAGVRRPLRSEFCGGRGSNVKEPLGQEGRRKENYTDGPARERRKVYGDRRTQSLPFQKFGVQPQHL